MLCDTAATMLLLLLMGEGEMLTRNYCQRKDKSYSLHGCWITDTPIGGAGGEKRNKYSAVVNEKP